VTGDDDGRGIGDSTEVVPYDQAIRRPGGASPKRLGRYTLERIIAQGGMAEIWLASVGGPSGFQKKVVVKRIRPGLVKLALKQQQQEGTEHNRTVEMFVREARLLARLEHANIVQVFELGVQPPKREGEIGEHFIVMEYLEGLTLKDLALRAWENKQPLPVEAVVRIIADVCLGLEHAHRLKDERGQPANLVHRDISPDNIFVTSAGTTKLLDFGIAKREDWSNLTMAGELKGKVPYMSPEQLKGMRVDGRTDLFALGVVMYWLLAGRRPFDGPSDIFTMKAILDDPPPSLRERNPNVPQMLEDVVMSCLQKEPDQRISSAAALHDALSMLLLSVQGKQTPVSQLVSSTLDVSTPTYEVVPDVAAMPSAVWARAPARASVASPVPTGADFGATGVRTAEMEAPAHLAPIAVAPPRTRAVVVDTDDAATLMQVDPADLPSTIPPPTQVMAMPVSSDGPTLQQPAPLPQPIVPSAASLANDPTRETVKPSWQAQVPAELRDTVDLSIVDVGANARAQGVPGTLTAPLPSPPRATLPPVSKAPASRSIVGPAIAALTGAVLTTGVFVGAAWMFGLLPIASGTAAADAGVVVAIVDAGIPAPAPPAPVVVPVVAIDAGAVDAGAVAALNIDAGAAAASEDAGAQLAEMPPGDDAVGGDDDDTVADAGPSGTQPPKRRRPVRIKQPAAVGEGFLVVRARPWARVSVDGLGLGTTPLPALPLPAGKHRLKLEHDGIVKIQSIDVAPQKTTTIQVDMREP
jgi:serine/threonine protein kinase